jgi:hypothetical protein
MTSRKDAIDTEEMLRRLERVGIARQDAEALRRISMQLHRWHELECGVENGGVERDETTGKTYWRTALAGTRWPCADRETGALKRLGSIMARYADQGLRYYVQGDPRGAALYVLRPGDVPEGASVDSCYSRGTAVYR